MDPVEGIIIAIAISVIPTDISHYLSSKELRKGFSEMGKGFEEMSRGFEGMREGFAKMDERFAKMDERFEQLAEGQTKILEAATKDHARILEAIKELAKGKSRR